MFQTWRNAFKQPELRKEDPLYFAYPPDFPHRFLHYRTFSGSCSTSKDLFQTCSSGDFLGYLNVMTGGALSPSNRLRNVYYALHQRVHYHPAFDCGNSCIGRLQKEGRKATKRFRKSLVT